MINATQLDEGKWQSLSNEEVLNNQKLLGEIYQNELAVSAAQSGYEIEPNGSGQFECKGYEQPLLDLFSTRNAADRAVHRTVGSRLKDSRRETAACEPKETGNPSDPTAKKERAERGAY